MFSQNRLMHISFQAFRPKHIFIALVSIILVLNAMQLGQELRRMKEIREKTPYIFIGVKFGGLKDILGNTSYIGYYTDKSMDNRVDALQFAQAQYTLAPIILDLNNTDHEYILFDCSQEQIAFEKIEEIGAIAIRKNQFGIILAKNPKAKQ